VYVTVLVRETRFMAGKKTISQKALYNNYSYIR